MNLLGCMHDDDDDDDTFIKVPKTVIAVYNH